MNSLSIDQINSFREEFSKDKAAKIAQNAVMSCTITDVALNRDIVAQTTHSFSNQIDEWSVTNQKSSGRCWLFAMLNLFRVGAAKKLKVKDFEFSQAHIHFFDKLERANHMLEAIIETADRDVDDRTVKWILGDPICDGGQWPMAINIIRRHGLVPKDVFPESQSSSATLQMNARLKDLLRSSACELRNILEQGGSVEAARKHKEACMKDVWRVLCIHLGTPPTKFDWSWTDKDKKHQAVSMTPVEFMNEYVTLDYEDYVCVVHDPRNPYMQTYTVDYLQSVAGGPKLIYLNVEVEMMKEITRRQLLDGLPVWMGCDVGKQLHRPTGIWHLDIFEYENLYGCQFGMNKRDRLLYSQTLMTHAMMFTGVDVDPESGKAKKWRVENSWGDANGKKGFYCMHDNWFNEHMFEIATPRSYLSEEMVKALDTTPIMLPAWDPMGSLAQDTV